MVLITILTMHDVEANCMIQGPIFAAEDEYSQKFQLPQHVVTRLFMTVVLVSAAAVR